MKIYAVLIFLFIDLLFILGKPAQPLLLYIAFMWFMIVMSVVLVALIARTYTYIATTPDKVLLINPILNHSGREFRISDIKNAKIVLAGGYGHHRIQLLTATGKTRRYIIDMVSEKDYPKLVGDLKNKGIEIEIIDHWELRKRKK